MKLSFPRFFSEISELSQLSQKSSIVWAINSIDGVSFLSTKLLNKRTKSPQIMGENHFENDVGLEFLDAAEAKLVVKNDTLSYEYHVVFSEAYQTPVLYFICRDLENHLLSLEEIYEELEISLDERSTLLISQQLHPLLDRPFFFLHPCHTADFMSKLDVSEVSGILIFCSCSLVF